MKFLIAGYGSIGRRHMRNLLALGERDILLYRTRHSTLPTDELDGFVVETDLQAALAHKPDAVFVANPTALHLDVAIPAAEAGCSIFMEKPVSHNLERIADLRQALMRGGGRLLVGFQYRFHPGLQQAKQLLADGAIGRPVSVSVHWGEYMPDWHPWEDYRQSYAARADLGGGVVSTLCHPLDYLRWLLGEIDSVKPLTARIAELEIEVESTAEIGLRFQNGAIGSLHLDYIQRPPAHWLEIIGTQGTLRWDNADGGLRIWQAAVENWQTLPAPDGFERNAMFMDETRHFIEVARGVEEPLCTLDDGLRVQELVNEIIAGGR